MHGNADAIGVDEVAVAAIYTNCARRDISIGVFLADFVQGIPAADV